MEKMMDVMNGLEMINHDGVAVVGSRTVANRFEKEHFIVTRDIEKLIDDMIKVNGENSQPTNLYDENSQPTNLGNEINVEKYFIESFYVTDRGRTYKEYLLTRDGFSLLVMGYEGTKALKWKLQYIDAFNMMEQEIKRLLQEKLEMEKYITKSVVRQLRIAKEDRDNSWQIQGDRKDIIDEYERFVRSIDESSLTREQRGLLAKIDALRELTGNVWITK